MYNFHNSDFLRTKILTTIVLFCILCKSISSQCKR